MSIEHIVDAKRKNMTLFHHNHYTIIEKETVRNSIFINHIQFIMKNSFFIHSFHKESYMKESCEFAKKSFIIL